MPKASHFIMVRAELWEKNKNFMYRRLRRLHIKYNLRAYSLFSNNNNNYYKRIHKAKEYYYYILLCSTHEDMVALPIWFVHVQICICAIGVVILHG